MTVKNTPLQIKVPASSRGAITPEAIRKSIHDQLQQQEFVTKVKDALVGSGEVQVGVKHDAPGGGTGG